MHGNKRKSPTPTAFFRICAQATAADLRGLLIKTHFVKTKYRGLPRRRGEKRGLLAGHLRLYNIIIKDPERGLQAVATLGGQKTIGKCCKKPAL